MRQILLIAGLVALARRSSRRSDAAQEPEQPGKDALDLVLGVQADAPGDDHANLNAEWATLLLRSGEPVEIAGWRLQDRAGHAYLFPEGTTLRPGREHRVYTGSGKNTKTRHYMGLRRAIWNNEGDTADLLDDSGAVVATYTY